MKEGKALEDWIVELNASFYIQYYSLYFAVYFKSNVELQRLHYIHINASVVNCEYVCANAYYKVSLNFPILKMYFFEI